VKLPKSAEAQKNEKSIAIKKGLERGIELTFLETRGDIKDQVIAAISFKRLVRGSRRVMIDGGTDWLGRLRSWIPRQ
jgi:hypothetical protein